MSLLRWTTRFISLVLTALFGYAIARGMFALGATTEVSQHVVYGFVGVSVALAACWTGMGELAGGLTLMGIVLWVLALTGYAPGALGSVAPFALVGALSLLCGLCELLREPQPQRHARHARHSRHSRHALA
jgi:hypothetical protein